MLNNAGIGSISSSCTGPNAILSSRLSNLLPRLDRRSEMRIAVYARVSTQRQAQAQTIEQQLERLRAHCDAQGWSLRDSHVLRDDGYSGASLHRPGLDRLREAAAAGSWTGWC